MKETYGINKQSDVECRFAGLVFAKLQKIQKLTNFWMRNYRGKY